MLKIKIRQAGQGVRADKTADQRGQAHLHMFREDPIHQPPGLPDGAFLVGLKRHARQAGHRQPGQQMVHGDVAHDRGLRDASPDPLGKTERIHRLVDRRQGQLVQALGVERGFQGGRQAADHIGSIDGLLVQAGRPRLRLSCIQHDQERRHRRRTQVDCQAQGRAAALVSLAGAKDLIGIHHHRRKHHLGVPGDLRPAGQAVIQSQLAGGEMLALDLVRGRHAALAKHFALAAGPPPGAGLLQGQTARLDRLAQHASQRRFHGLAFFPIDHGDSGHFSLIRAGIAPGSARLPAG